ncbi:PTS sugar transporter subunit IIB [Pectinatus brassicae]|uniref:PTS system ascorbate-specific IIB component n=1 Tax=Pectinatus brassicae TaxID=862415 RepID=A0A840UE26_9FIRM|nr:PTS sugar transporter subunit IIB [Pectinatus brassicae]MBB5335971.1 PTS system ascorbate-specific IIB component [Pectinatus brassicae]
MKFLCICQSGLGSSFMVQMNIQNVLNAMNVTEEISVDHSDVGSTTPDLADYFFVDQTLGEAVANLPAERVILLKSLIDQNEIKTAVSNILDKESISHS